MKKIAALIAIILALSLFSACNQAKKNGNDAAKPVEVGKVASGLMESSISYTGSIRAVHEAKVFSKVAGKVEQIYFEEGDAVTKGDLLIKLEDRDLIAQVNQAKASLEMAEAHLNQARAGRDLQSVTTATQIQQANNLAIQAQAGWELAEKDMQRMKNLFTKGAISRQTLDQAEMQEKVARKQLDSAREGLTLAQAQVAQNNIRKEDIEVAKAGVNQALAALQLAETQLSYTEIRSPLDGVVISKTVKVGELVPASVMGGGAPLIEIVDNRNIQVEFQAAEKDVSYLKAGREVKVLVDALKNGNFNGVIEKVIPAIDNQTRSFKVKVAVLNPEGLLKSGMFVQISLITYKNPDAVLVPRESILKRSGKTVVFVVENNRAKMKEVKTGVYDDKNYEIISGLSQGESLVLEGQHVLNEGDEVRIEKGV